MEREGRGKQLNSFLYKASPLNLDMLSGVYAGAIFEGMASRKKGVRCWIAAGMPIDFLATASEPNLQWRLLRMKSNILLNANGKGNGKRVLLDYPFVMMSFEKWKRNEHRTSSYIFGFDLF